MLSVCWMGLVSLLFGVGRFAITKFSERGVRIYKSLAHIWVGSMIGAGAAGYTPAGWLGLSLTILEIVAFALSRKPK